ncbi:MAG: hypothetical protein LBC18_12725 [Opitutaceae bacterium]|nr:hypothetical protein [Opitutaceae bacterium]
MSTEPPTAPAGAPAARKQKRRARWFIAGLILVPLATFAVFLYSLTLDEPPPGIGDLTTPPPHYNPSATHCFNNAIIAMEPLYPRELHGGKYMNEVGEMEYGEKWHPQVAAELFAAADKNNLWESFDKALEAPDELNDWGGTSKGVLYFINLARFIKLHAFHQSRIGDHGGAIHSALQIIEFGGKIENNEYSTLRLLAGCSAKAIGVDTLGEVLKACGSITAPDARSWCERLSSRQPDLEKIIPLAMRAEVVFNVNLVSPSPYIYVTIIDAPYSRLLEKIYFKPNQTLRLIAENTRARMAGVGPYFSSCKELATRLAPELERQCRRRSPFDIVNKDGRAVVQMIFEGDLSTMRRYYAVKSLVSAAQAGLAARAYEHDHGELPGTLDALVPAYLPAVPIDYMDGRPIRYSKAERAVWTIGPDNLAAPLPPVPATRSDHTEDEEPIFRLDHRPRPPAEPPPAAGRPDTPAP